MQFKDYLASFPAIDHLRGLDVKNATGEVIHTIPAIEGKLGSLKLYHALFAKFDGKLTACSAQQGLVLKMPNNTQENIQTLIYSIKSSLKIYN